MKICNNKVCRTKSERKQFLYYRVPVLSLFPYFSLPDVLCDRTDLIRKKGIPFEAMTGRAAPSSDGLLAGVFLGSKTNARRSSTAPRIISSSPLSLAIEVTDATLGASGLWLGTRTGAGGTDTLVESFLGRDPWFHGQQVSHNLIITN